MCLRVTFVDGTSGEVRLGRFLGSARVSGTVFEPLRDPEVFRQVRVDLAAVTWPNGADLAPDAMYALSERMGTGWSAGEMSPEPANRWVVTPHAAFEMERRRLPEDVMRQVLAQPEQRFGVRPGREVLQSRRAWGTPPGRYLVRVFVDVNRPPPEVVTAYFTSKIDKYWRQGP
jgi:hypothetical protein